MLLEVLFQRALSNLLHVEGRTAGRLTITAVNAMHPPYVPEMSLTQAFRIPLDVLGKVC